MKYKAIIFDLDGTAVPNRADGMPGERLIEVVGKIKNKVFICAATGRAITFSRHILKKLGLIAPCIISGGTQVIDPLTEKVLWSKSLAVHQVEAVMEIARQYDYKVYFSDDTIGELAKDKLIKNSENIIYIEPVNADDTKKILTQLSKIPDITAHPVMSWTAGHFDIHITHKEATKKHSVEVLLGILNVKKEEVIGFGDSDNDLPIFEAVGYKVAMSNGSEALKQAADFIAPHAEADGLAEAIEKLVVI